MTNSNLANSKIQVEGTFQDRSSPAANPASSPPGILQFSTPPNTPPNPLPAVKTGPRSPWAALATVRCKPELPLFLNHRFLPVA